MTSQELRQRQDTLRLRAEEVRVCAESMLDQGCRGALLAMAASYEAMARSLDNSLVPEMERLAAGKQEKSA